MTKTTLKGHGKPEQIMYFGVEKEPFPQGVGWLVTVVDQGRSGYEMVDPTGTYPTSQLSLASKFWGEAA